MNACTQIYLSALYWSSRTYELGFLSERGSATRPRRDLLIVEFVEVEGTVLRQVGDIHHVTVRIEQQCLLKLNGCGQWRKQRGICLACKAG
jgi:hypothetical protein